MESLSKIATPVGNKLARTMSIVALTLCIAISVVPEIRAQERSPQPAPNEWTTLVAQESDLLGGTVSSRLVGRNLDNLSAKEWKRVRNEHLERIRSQDDATWRAAAVDIIYLSHYHKNEINMRRASLPLLERYIFDSDEDNRVLALAAIHAIGHRDTMAHLSQRVRLERSERVRRLTVAAVRDYFAPRDGAIDIRGGGLKSDVASN